MMKRSVEMNGFLSWRRTGWRQWMVLALAVAGGHLPAAQAQTPSPSGTVITIAGNGANGYSGDGGPATSANIFLPSGAAIGPDGTIYFSNSGNHRIRAIDLTTGFITTVAGNGSFGDTGDNGPATSATVSSVFSLAVDPTRNALYFADIDNNRIRKVDLSTGQMTAYAGVGISGFGYNGNNIPANTAWFAFPTFVATDAEGALYITDNFNNLVRRVDPVSGLISDYGATGLYNPFEITVDSAGNAYVIHDTYPDLVRQIERIDALSGAITTIAGGGTNDPNSGPGPATGMDLALGSYLSVSSTGQLFIGCANQVFKMDLDSGQMSVYAGANPPGYSGDGGPAIDAQFDDVRGVTVTPAGEVIICDLGSRLRYVVPESIHLVNSGQTALRLPYISSLSGDFIVTGNADLALIDAPALTAIGGDIEVSNNAGDLAASALATVTTVGGGVDVNGNTGASSIDLGALTGTGDGVSVSGNTSALTINLSALATVGGSVTITDNSSVGSIDLASLTSVGGDVDISGNTAATSIDMSNLPSAGDVNVSGNTNAGSIDLSGLTDSGDVNVSGNTNADSIDLSGLTDSGDVNVSGNTNAGSIDLSGLTDSGDVNVSGNTNAGSIDLSGLTNSGDVDVSDNPSATNLILGPLTTVDGNVTIGGNSAALTIDLGSLTTVGGDVNITNNTSATSIDLGSLTSTPSVNDVNFNGFASTGDVNITGNDSATDIDLGSLTSSGGNVIITGNSSASSIDLSSFTTSGGDLNVSGNSVAASVSLGSLATVSGNLTVETAGSGTFDVSGAVVAGNSDLTTRGYDTVGAQVAGGETALVMINGEATMEMKLPDGAYLLDFVPMEVHHPGTTYSEVVGQGVVTHIEEYQFDLADPTLETGTEAELDLEIDLSAMELLEQTTLLSILHAGGEITLARRGDEIGAELELFDIGPAPIVDTTVLVRWLNANHDELPVGGLTDPSYIRVEGLVSHFSDYSMVMVPEPETVGLLAIGAAALIRRRRAK